MMRIADFNCLRSIGEGTLKQAPNQVDIAAKAAMAAQSTLLPKPLVAEVAEKFSYLSTLRLIRIWRNDGCNTKRN
jgi:hypothetical protein